MRKPHIPGVFHDPPVPDHDQEGLSVCQLDWFYIRPHETTRTIPLNSSGSPDVSTRNSSPYLPRSSLKSDWSGGISLRDSASSVASAHSFSVKRRICRHLV